MHLPPLLLIWKVQADHIVQVTHLRGCTSVVRSLSAVAGDRGQRPCMYAYMYGYAMRTRYCAFAEGPAYSRWLVVRCGRKYMDGLAVFMNPTLFTLRGNVRRWLTKCIRRGGGTPFRDEP